MTKNNKATHNKMASYAQTEIYFHFFLNCQVIVKNSLRNKWWNDQLFGTYFLHENFSDIHTVLTKVAFITYHQPSNISCILAGNKIVNHSDVVGASFICPAPTSSFSTSTPGFKRLHKDKCKMKQETFKFWCVLYLRFDSISQGT